MKGVKAMVEVTVYRFEELKKQAEADLKIRLQPDSEKEPPDILTDICDAVASQIDGISDNRAHDLLFEIFEACPEHLQRAFRVWVEAGSPRSYEYPFFARHLLEDVLYFALEDQLPASPEDFSALVPTDGS